MSYPDSVSNSGIPKIGLKIKILGTRTHDLPAYNIVPQATMLPHARVRWSASCPGYFCLGDSNTVTKNNHNKYKQLKQLPYYNLLEGEESNIV
jgi:hypothetical protein